MIIKANFLFLRTYVLLLFSISYVISYSQNIIVTPYLQNGSPSQMSIMWETDAPNDGFVDWGIDVFSLDNTEVSTSINSDANNRIHTVLISGLAPNTKYYYKVRMTSGTESSLFTFKTHPTKTSEASLNFVAMSDMQRDNSNPDVFETIVDLGVIPIANASYTNGIEAIEAILIPGDLVGTGTHNSWRNSFFEPSDEITPFIPTYPVPGNHEYYGDGISLYLDYFNLPLNGTTSNPEEWWFKDISNVRLIGINSNSSSADLAIQLTWLQSVLDNAGTDNTIDFVFVQLHHPFKSELWTPGELDFTGEIIALLEPFSTLYNKPSIHFFGHTHAYSRGQSRDHNHLWVNVATAGGAIDNWGEFPNADYDEFVISEDEYGFVMLEVEAGADPKFTLKRYSQGDSVLFENNTLSDEITVKRFDTSPETPTGLSPTGDILINCVELKASAFENGENTHQATHWQIVSGCDFNDPSVIDIWKQATNFYDEVNTQLNDNLTDEQLGSITLNTDYCWRVRYRNDNLTWSDWSTPLSFTTTTPSYITTNLLLNPEAELGIENWTGDIESLTSNECDSVPVYQGTNFFGVGGICVNEMETGIAFQDIDVSSFATEIDAGSYSVEFLGYLRTFDIDNDLPEMFMDFIDGNNVVLNTTTTISNNTPEWLLRSVFENIPSGTRVLRATLKGNRLTGSDNDSYYDALSVRLMETNCETLDIIDTNLENNIKIFPNPASRILNYDSVNIFEKVEITDLSGRNMYSEKILVKMGFIDISNLSDGVYIISFINGEKRQSLKFIKID